MDFLTVIIAYIISISLSGHGDSITNLAIKWRILTSKPKWGFKISLTLYALLPALLVGGLLHWADSVWLSFVLAIGFLLLAFKTGDQPESLAEYQVRKEHGEDQAAWKLAVDELGLERQMYEPGDAGLDEGVQAGVAYLYLERFFVSVFWFMAFGGPGVFLVWLISTASHDKTVDAFCYRVKQALYWIPVRLMALTLGLMGHFTHCFQVWVEQAKDFDRDDRVLLVTCLKSSLGDVPEDQMLTDTLSLIKRAQWTWLIGLALLTLFGW